MIFAFLAVQYMSFINAYKTVTTYASGKPGVGEGYT
jgi:hypothetical protein